MIAFFIIKVNIFIIVI